MPNSLTTPKAALLAGAAILEEILSPFGFAFEFRAEGEINGEHFAWGEFVQGDRSLELHFHNALSSVSYYTAGGKASHESYMRELGVWGRHRYPGFSPDALGGFRDLAHDLEQAQDFLSGDGSVLAAAAAKEAASAAVELRRLKAIYMGDGDRVEEIQGYFDAGNYAEVLRVYGDLKFPDLLSEAELGMIEMARGKAAN